MVRYWIGSEKLTGDNYLCSALLNRLHEVPWKDMESQ